MSMASKSIQERDDAGLMSGASGYGLGGERENCGDDGQECPSYGDDEYLEMVS